MAGTVMLASSRLLQRKCACGGPVHGGGECVDCARKKRLVQREATGDRAAALAPPVVGRVLADAGQSLDPTAQRSMEARFGHNFARVRVHTGSDADASAQALHAHAYTVGSDIVFRHGQYEPHTSRGQRLLAHELAHVVQQSGAASSANAPIEVAPSNHPSERDADHAAATAMSGGSAAVHASRSVGRAIQRQSAGGEDEHKRTDAGLPSSVPQLHLDPAIEAEMRAIRARALLDPAVLRSTLLRLDVDSLISTPPPRWATPVKGDEPQPLVPRGAGPETPRPAGVGDLLKAVSKVPAVDGALTNLQLEAERQARVGWGGLSTGERAMVITQSALIGGGAVAGILSQPDARQFALDVLQNRLLPTGVPGLQFQFNLTGPDQRIEFQLNVGALLPRSLGFR